MISVCTAWRDHIELLTEYGRAVQGAQAVIFDDCADSDASRDLGLWALHNGGLKIRNFEEDFSFADACNQCLLAASGDIVVMLNNDIVAVPGWLDAVARDVRPGALYGPATDIRVVNGQPILYVEGWCVAAHRDTWDALGGFDAETFQRPYWEDVDLSWRATQQGIRLLRRPWMVTHLGNVTSATTPGAYDGTEANRRAFERKVLAARVAVAA